MYTSLQRYSAAATSSMGGRYSLTPSTSDSNAIRIELEKECLANNAKHKRWECTDKLMSLTKDGRALYMHPLPADITDVSCPAGEVSKSVFEKYRVPTYKEAEHKLYVIAAMILLTRFEHPANVLKQVVDRAVPRRAE